MSGLVGHSFGGLDFFGDGKVALCDLVGDFLVGLDQIAAQAAACLESIYWEISLDVVVFSDLSLLDELEDRWKADAAREPETQASGVNWRVSLEGGRLAKSVMGLAEGDTWTAASDEAGINRSEAAEERAGPGVWTSGRLGDDFRLADSVLESSDPGIDVIWVDSRCCSSGVLLRSCHFGGREFDCM